RASWSLARRATSADCVCKRWSTTTARNAHPAARASKAVTAASASESAPPETANSTSEPAGRSSSAPRTNSLPRATAGSRLIALVEYPHDPLGRIGDLGGRGKVVRLGPYRVETAAADSFGHRTHEGGAVSVLTHFGAQPEDFTHDSGHALGAVATLLELLADLFDGGYNLRSDTVHDHICVAF